MLDTQPAPALLYWTEEAGDAIMRSKFRIGLLTAAVMLLAGCGGEKEEAADAD